MKLVSLLCCGLLTACTTSSPTLDLGDNAEAREIYGDLVESGFLDPQQAATFGTGVSNPMSSVVRYLKLLSGSDSESEAESIRREISREIAPLGASSVCFRTPTPGAQVRYRAMHLSFVDDGPQTNVERPHPMPLGIYYVWAERGGQATTSRDKRVRITRRSQRINLEVELGDTSHLPDCHVE